jgi:hypothetical protein
MNFFKRLFSRSDVPNIGMTPQEININVSPQSKTLLARHAGRLSRILTIQKKTPELKAEIKMRQGALMMAGFNAPKIPEDAREIQKQLEAK